MKLLHENAPPSALRAAHVYVFVLWIAKIATEPLERLAEWSPENLLPIGVLRLIPAAVWPWIFSAGVLLAFRVLTVACLLAALFQRTRAPAALASAVLLTLHQGLVRGIGYVNHSELPLLYAVYILAASAVLERAAKKHPPAPPLGSDVPLIAIAGVLCFTYTATGISRLVVGAPAVFRPDTLTMWIAGYGYETTYHGWTVGRAVLDLPSAWRPMFSVGLIVVTAAELSAFCCLGSRRYRQFFLAVMIPFHLISYVMLNILFWENLALYAFLLDATNFRFASLLGQRPPAPPALRR